MDRRQVYAGQIPVEDDILMTNKFAMVGVARLAEALLGRSNTWISGAELTANPASDPEPFQVHLSDGQVYQLAVTDATEYGGSVPPDSTIILKQGLMGGTQTFECPRPAAGHSVVYLISTAFIEEDRDAQVLLYYNAADPDNAFSGPGNSGAAQAVTRAGRMVVQFTTGVEAVTGQETVPPTPPGYIPLWTVRVRDTTPPPIPPANDATGEGYFKVGAGHYIRIGGGGGLDQGTADTLYAKLNGGNTLNGLQTIQLNAPVGLTITGSSNASGAGITIRGNDQSGVILTPSKRLSVRAGVFVIMNHGATGDLFTLDDAGNAAITGVLAVTGKITTLVQPSNGNDVVNKAYADNTYALKGQGGFITQDQGDARYLQKLELPATDPMQTQTIHGQIAVSTQPDVIPNVNTLITRAWADKSYASLALSGVTPSQGNDLWLELARANNSSTPRVVSTFVSFTRAVLCGEDASDNSHLVRFSQANTLYARLAQPVTFTNATVKRSTVPSTGDDITTVSFCDSKYLKLTAGQTITGTVTFGAGGSLLVPQATLDSQAVNFGQMKTAITGGQGYTKTEADNKFGQKDGNNSWTQANAFSQVPTTSGDPATVGNTAFVTVGYCSKFAPLVDPTFTTVVKGVTGDAQHTDCFVTYNKVFGSGGGFATLGANSFTGAQTITSATGPGIILATPAAGLAGIQFPGGATLSLSAAGNWDFFNSGGVAMFAINAATGTISNYAKPGDVQGSGDLLIGRNITAGGYGSFAGTVSCAKSSAPGHAVRQDQFQGFGGAASGHLTLPNGWILNWGYTDFNQTSQKEVFFHQAYGTIQMATVAVGDIYTGVVTASSQTSLASVKFACNNPGNGAYISTRIHFFSIGY